MYRDRLPLNMKALMDDVRGWWIFQKLETRAEDVQKHALNTIIDRMGKISIYRKRRTKLIVSYWISSSRIECIKVMDANIYGIILEYFGIVTFDSKTKMKTALKRYILLTEN